MRELFRDQRGIALIWLLIFLPMLLSVPIFLADYTQATTESDIDVQKGLEQAVKAAAMMVTQDSQAAGRPKINTARALTAFNRVLASNLGLDASTLAPLPGSAMKQSPDYVLVIYNGDNSFAASGAEAAWKYVFSNGVLSGGPLAASGFPYKFGVTASDVIPGGGGTVNVTLDMPGAVAVINTSVVKVVGRDAITPVRYAAAKIVCPSGSCGQ